MLPRSSYIGQVLTGFVATHPYYLEGSWQFVWAGGIYIYIYLGGYQNCGPLLGPLNTMCRIIIRRQKGTIILTATHIDIYPPRSMLFYLQLQVAAVSFWSLMACLLRS